jgi:hypothetical protein
VRPWAAGVGQGRGFAAGPSGAVLTVLGLLLAWPAPGGPGAATSPRPPPAVEARPVPPGPSHVRPPIGASWRDPTVPRVSAQGLSVAIEAPGSTWDMDIAAPVTANVSGGVPPYEVRWNDSRGDWGFGATWSVNGSVPGTVSVLATVTDALGEIAASTLQLSFVAPPSLTVSAVPDVVDVGVPFSLRLVAAAGVAPLQLNWTLAGSVPNGTVLPTSNMTFVVPAIVSDPGPVDVTATILDACGVPRVVSETVAEAYATPTLAVSPTPAFADAGSPFDLRGLITGGAPPISWTVLPDVIVSSAAPEQGMAGPNGSFEWAAAFDAPGNATLDVVVTDGVGQIASGVLSVDVLPGLSVELVSPASAVPVGSVVDLTASVQGGSPPYEWSLASQQGAGPAGSAAVPGNLTVALRVSNMSELSLLLTVVDALGATSSVTLSIPTVPPGTLNGSPPVPSVPSSLFGDAATPVAIGLSVLTAVALLVPRWRRRRAAATTDPAEAIRVVERILLEEDGMDRETLAFRGESEGLDRAEVFAALAELRRSGRLTVREGLDQEELLALKVPAPADTTGGVP